MCYFNCYYIYESACVLEYDVNIRKKCLRNGHIEFALGA